MIDYRKHFRLPSAIPFEGAMGKYRYAILDSRPPRKGEYYLSGSIVEAWRAPNDLTTAYLIVKALSPLKARQIAD